MRPALALGLVLLGLTFALDHPSWLRERAAAGREADEALEILATARGPLLPMPGRADGTEPSGESIVVGTRTFARAGARGLQAVFLDGGRLPRGPRVFDVAASPEDTRALRAEVERARPDDVLVLASGGTLQPLDGRPRSELDAVLALLGARARVGARARESWALVALRQEQGWIPLAEGYSQESGLTLAFLLSSDSEAYMGYRGDFAEVRVPARNQVRLERELASASLRSAGVRADPEARVRGRPLGGIRLEPAGAGEAARANLAWDEIEIGDGTGFLAWGGLADGVPDDDGAALELTLDGERVLAHRFEPGTPWKVLACDLRRFAGRRVRLELVVDAGADGRGALVLGRPLLVNGYDRSPLEAMTPER